MNIHLINPLPYLKMPKQKKNIMRFPVFPSAERLLLLRNIPT